MPDLPYSHNIQQLEVLITGNAAGGIEYRGGTQGHCLYNDADTAIQRAYMPAGTLFDEHQHNVAEILIVTSGQLIVTANAERRVLNQADVVRILPHTLHSCEATADTWVIGLLVPRNGGYPISSPGETI
jgi:quercetin dioxygenase-like cupin family protein